MISILKVLQTVVSDFYGFAPCKGIQHSLGLFHALDSGFQVLDFRSFVCGPFRNPIVGSIPATRKITRIPNSTSKNFRISLQWAIGIIDGQTDRENKKIFCSFSEWLSYSIQNCLLIALFFQPNLPRKSSVKPRKDLFISNPSDWSA